MLDFMLNRLPPRPARAVTLLFTTSLGITALLHTAAWPDMLALQDGRQFECVIVGKSSTIYSIKYLNEDECEIAYESIHSGEIVSLRRERDSQMARNRLENLWAVRIKNDCAKFHDYFAQSEQESSVATETNDETQYVSSDFMEFNELFEQMARSQKKRLWREYRGQRVRWTGVLAGVEEGFASINVRFTHSAGTSTHNVLARFPKSCREELSRLQPGAAVNYAGRLLERPGLLSRWEVTDAAVLSSHLWEADPGRQATGGQGP